MTRKYKISAYERYKRKKKYDLYKDDPEYRTHKYVEKYAVTDDKQFRFALLFLGIGLPATIVFILAISSLIIFDNVFTLITTGITGIFNLINGLIRLERCVKLKTVKVPLTAADRLGE